MDWRPDFESRPRPDRLDLGTSKRPEKGVENQAVNGTHVSDSPLSVANPEFWATSDNGAIDDAEA